MAVNEIKDISELLNQINGKPLEETHFKWTSDAIEPFSSISLTDTGTLHSTYGAVPNVSIGGMSGTGTVWTTANAGATWTTTSTGTGPVWQSPYTAIGTGQNVQPSGKVVIQGKDADLVIGDKSMRDWMEKVEERLNILTPNPELEKEWDDLRKLGERYRKLEKKCREKADMWKRLKSMPKPNINI
jgi:hypothetical protein